MTAVNLVRIISVILLTLLLAEPFGVAYASGQDCAAVTQEQPARIDSIAARGEFNLADGRKIRPLGIVIMQSSILPGMIERQLPIWRGRDIDLAHLSPHPDRWGRHSSWAATPSIMAGHDPLPVTLALLQDGVGLADPSEVPLDCRKTLLKAEADARRGKRGIWRDGEEMMINANTPAGSVRQRSGQFSVMEGRVLRVGEGRQRNFIDFGTRGSGAASGAIPRRNMAMVLPSGIKLADLKGKRLRMRGVLEWQLDRPFMLLDTVAMIEVLD